MKSKLLPRIWSGTMCAFCGFMLPFFFCSALLANNNIPGIIPAGSIALPDGYNTLNFQQTIISGKITDENGAAIAGANVLE